MMTEEEKYISEQMGRRNPFVVPEGYFDKLADQIIGQLPAEKKRKPIFAKYLRPLLYAAACIALAVGGVTIYQDSRFSDAQAQMAQQEQGAELSDTYLDEVTDYAMIGNDEIYASLLADI